MLRKCHLYLDGEPFNFDVNGKFFWGEDEVLFEENDNVISKVEWTNQGYSVVSVFSEEEFESLINSIKNNLLRAFRDNGVEIDEDIFELEKYHEFITSKELHNNIISITRNLEVSDFDLDLDRIALRFGEILGYKLSTFVPELGKSHVQIRISRPNSLDINPPHKDGYLSYWKDIINVWIPIVGCNEKSSLPVFPGSHFINEKDVLRTESKGAIINGNTYYVPCILAVKDREMKMVRPNPKSGEALIFSPFLIHGAATNGNKDLTRISLELRFPKARN